MRRFVPLFLFALLAVIGCGGSVTVISDTVSPVGPLNLTAGQSVTLTASVSGDPSNSGVTWSLLNGAGTLSGQTPTSVVYTAPTPVTTTGSVAVLAVPVKNALYSAAVTINYGPAPTFVNTSLPNATIGAAYSAQLNITGGTAPYTFALVSGTLPQGLMFSTSGLLSGTPTAPGTTTLTFRATDSSSTPATVTTVLTLVVAANKLAISTTSIPNGVTGQAYSTTLAASGGIAPLTWTASSGLPAGFMLSSAGVLSGNTMAAGTYSFTAKVTDSEATPQTATQTYNFTIYPALTITTTSLPTGSLKNSYSATIAVSGGVQPYTFALAPGSTLPAGLMLSPSGVISGTPTSAGQTTTTVQVSDQSSPKQTTTATYTITIVTSTLAITTTSLPNGTVSVNYSATLTSSGGNPPVTWSLAPNSAPLPAGLGISPTGTISGQPTTAGTYTFTVQATDSTPASVTQSLTITVVPLATLTITTTSLPAGNIGSSYSATIAATGGATPYTFSAPSGTLPPGLSFSTAGVLSGTPVAAGSYTFTAQVKDSESTPATTSRQFTVSIGTTLATGPNNASLAGGYAFLVNGHTAGSTSGAVYGFGAVGNLTFASGAVTGVEDMNTAGGVQTSLAVTGTYSLGAGNRGLLVLTAGGTTTVYAIAASNFASGVAQSISLTEFDNATGTGNSATGFAKRQTAAAFTAATVNGVFAFGLSGESPCSTCATGVKFGPVDAVGVFTANGVSAISAGQEDAAAYSTNYTGVTLAGSFTAPSSSTGRGTLSLTPTGTLFAAAPVHYTYVVVSANELLLLSSDSHATTTLLYGDVQLQQQASYSTASLAGRSIGYESQASGGDGSVTYPTALNAILTELTNTGAGTATLAQDANRAGVFKTSAATAITYTTGSNGRTAITTGGTTNQVLYLYNTGAGFALDQAATAAYPALVQYEQQSGATSSFPVLLSGAYAAGTLANPVAASIASGEDTFALSTGGVNAGLNGNLTTTTDSSTTGGTLTLGQAGSFIFTEDATGRLSVTAANSTSPTAIVYAVTPKRAVEIGTGSSTLPTVTVLQQ